MPQKSSVSKVPRLTRKNSNHFFFPMDPGWEPGFLFGKRFWKPVLLLEANNLGRAIGFFMRVPLDSLSCPPWFRHVCCSDYLYYSVPIWS